MNPAQQKANAKQFVQRWLAEPGNEEEQSRSFWIQLLEEVLGVSNATHVLQFERKVKGRKIDVFYEDMGILIEQKGRGISLDEATIRSKKAGLETPYEQARWYAENLPFSIRPRWIITCNFDEIRIYDQDKEDPDQYESILLENLPEEAHRLSFFTNKQFSRIEQEKQLSVQAGEIVGRLYAQLSSQYKNIETDKHEQYSLNVLIVRLVFLLYAEDAGLLQQKDAFLNYMRAFESSQMRGALINLFKVLDTPEDERDPYLSEELLAFPYINGDLYSDKIDIVIPQLTDQIRLDLLLEASQKFNWSNISPTIFGAVFESTLNPETRRAGGMHYTSIGNIHKVIDPLFLNDLKAELEEIEGEKSEKNRQVKLRIFQKKLAGLNIFDPACGSGNFLTESYLSLRKLENRVIESLQGDQISFDLDTESLIQVSIAQFYGIEINDFAVSVAKTALWIAEEQMMEATQEVVLAPFNFLPLKSNSNIHEGNALRMDWNDVLPAEKCSYICGNPPFIGYSNHSKEQQEDRALIFGKVKTVDYVACWYKKAAEYMKGEHIRAAFVSTNSICQGQQVEPIWKPLFEDGIQIDFAYRSFIWDSEATDQAHVHVVIVGFSREGVDSKLLFEDSVCDEVEHINGYLADAADVFVGKRAKPLCKAPTMVRGCQPTDGGNLLFKSEQEKTDFLKVEPEAKKWIRPFSMGEDFIKGKPRYCLWMPDAADNLFDGMPYLQERLKAVRTLRLDSTKVATRKKAETPWRFDEVREFGDVYIGVPKVSSERRSYIPLGFVKNGMIPGDKLYFVSSDSLYVFGILMSQFHNAWMRVVAGRLEMRYSYANTIVYNNLVWPGAVENPDVPVEEAVPADVRTKIESCAQAVLDARDNYPDKSLANLYDPDKMPSDLLAAHKALDAAVEEAYDVSFNGDEEKIVAHLFKLYAEMTEGK